MTGLLDVVSGALLIGGGFFCLVGGVGLIRMPDFFTRMHAASVTETLGVGLTLLGMMLIAGWSLVTLKLAMIGLLVFFVSPTASHVLARAALLRGVRPLLAEAEGASSKR